MTRRHGAGRSTRWHGAAQGSRNRGAGATQRSGQQRSGHPTGPETGAQHRRSAKSLTWSSIDRLAFFDASRYVGPTIAKLTALYAANLAEAAVAAPN
jgi:hypothetical protein